MSMRLLPKSEVDKAKATEQKQAVDEGMKLARRVDNLREVAASEEVSLETFRRVTVAKIHEEISTEASKRDELKTEVAIIEERRKKALETLDKEWEEIRIAKEELQMEGSVLGERDFNIRKLEQLAAAAKSEAGGILARTKTKDELSNTRLHDAESVAIEAESTLARARLVEEAALHHDAKVNEALTHRENIVLTRENDATIREKEILEREKSLGDGWILLRDRQATLEHEIKRARK